MIFFFATRFLLLLFSVHAANYKNYELPNMPGIFFENFGDIKFIESNWKIVVVWKTDLTQFDHEMFFEKTSKIMKQCRTVLNQEETCDDLHGVGEILLSTINSTVEEYNELISDMEDFPGNDNYVRRPLKHYKRSIPAAALSMTKYIASMLIPRLLSNAKTFLERFYMSHKAFIPFLSDQLHLVSIGASSYFRDLQSLKELLKNTTDLLNRSRTSSVPSNYRANFHLALYKMQLQIDETRKLYQRLAKIVRSARLGKLHPETIKKSDLQELVSHIIEKNPKYAFPISAEHVTAEKLSAVSKTNVVFREGHLFIEIDVPLIEQHTTMLYKIHPVFVPLAGGTSGSIQTKHEFMAVNTHQKFYTFLKKSDLGSCVPGANFQICDIQYVLNSMNKSLSCDYLIHSQLSEENVRKCSFIIRKSQENNYVYLESTRAWLYSVIKHTRVNIECASEEGETIYLESTGILELNPGCKGVVVDDEVILKGPPLDEFITVFHTTEDYWRPKMSLSRVVNDTFLEKTSVIIQENGDSRIFLNSENDFDYFDSVSDFINKHGLSLNIFFITATVLVLLIYNLEF